LPPARLTRTLLTSSASSILRRVRRRSPTIGAFAQRLPAGFETRPYQCTDGTVYVCLEGEATVAVGNTEWQLQRDDIFVVPSWQSLKLLAQRDTTLFSYSDRPAQQSLGLWREARL
jgi:Gentisate 1,2-dioxygenase